MDILRELANFYSQLLFTLNYFSILIWGSLMMCGMGVIIDPLCGMGVIIDPPGKTYD
jgi:hypothetical protein